jgi:hypothetical protein
MRPGFLLLCEAMQTAFEFGYLAVILDTFSREVIGWEARLYAEPAISAPGDGHHSKGAEARRSDPSRGVQYACIEYGNLCGV